VLWEELNAESNKLAILTAEDTLVHRDKDMNRFAEELADEGEDEDIEYIEEDDIEDLDDFDYEYEEDQT
jgi:GTP-binding protein